MRPHHQPQLSLAKRSCQHCDIHYAPFKGRSYKVIFDNGKLVLSNGDSCQMSGSLEALIPFGDSLHCDFKGILAEEKGTFKWAESTGLIEQGTNWWNASKKADTQYLASRFCPGVPLCDAKLLSRTILFLFWLDDIIDDRSHTGRSDEFSYGDIVTDLSNLSLRLSHDNAEENRKKLIRNVLPRFEAACKGLEDLRANAISIGPDPKPFLDSFALYIRYCSIQASLKLNPGEIEYTFIRERTHGATLTLEAILLVHRIQLEKQQREDPMLSLFFHLICFHVALGNDILGVRREAASGEDINIVLVKRQATGNLQTAFNQSVQEVNSITKKLFMLKSKILEQFLDDKVVEKAVEVAMNFANGHIQYYVKTKRYGNDNLYYEFE